MSWIKTEERLPEECRQVLALAEDGRYVTATWFANGLAFDEDCITGGV